MKEILHVPVLADQYINQLNILSWRGFRRQMWNKIHDEISACSV